MAICPFGEEGIWLVECLLVFKMHYHDLHGATVEGKDDGSYISCEDLQR
jgi:hypothetical protein